MHRTPHLPVSPAPLRSLVLAVTLLAVASCSGATTDSTTTPTSATTTDTTTDTTTAPATTIPIPIAAAFPPIDPDQVGRWVPEILDRIDHDPEAFTQGLLVDDGVVYEGTGLYGESTIREVDRITGEVLREEALEAELFGEGVELVDDRLLQLTWQEGTLVVWDRDQLAEIDRISYEGEGWGLCRNDDVLVMSNGSSELAMRDPETFDVIETVAVTLEGVPLDMLNELECVDGWVFANVWMTTDIVAIDPATGNVVGLIDASSLDEEVAADAPDRDVLNGIAYDPDTDTFLVTGKLWPAMFEVRFVDPTP